MMEPSSVPTLSLLAMFDDIVRGNDVLLEGGCEEDFLRFALSQQDCQKKWLNAEVECRRLQSALDQSNRTIAGYESKLSHARRLYDEERHRAKQAINEKTSCLKQMDLIREMVCKNNEQTQWNDETREKLPFFCDPQTRERVRASMDQLNTINETGFDSTCSLLSDLMYSQSENEFDESLLQTGKPFKKYRPSGEGGAKGKKRKSSMTGDRVVATTTVTVHRDGPVQAQSIIQAKSGAAADLRKKPRMDVGAMHKPSSPIETTDTDSDPMWQPRTPQVSTPLMPYKSTSKFQLPSLVQTPLQAPGGTGLGYRSTPGMISRAHNFVVKTVMIPEQCICGKRMKFAKPAVRCQNCRTVCHTQCKELIPLPCIPYVDTPTRAPAGKCVLADYAPSASPMVPGLIVHCIMEIERRGLSEVGLYRVPGADREVRSLKEKFLQNKGIPSLAAADVHTLCGTVKDFLRSLKEPLLTEYLRSDFIEASCKDYTADTQSALYQAISQLPQPNRDTLAFLMLHLQRIANCNDVKMPAMNLAKVFAPTLVGQSNNDAPCAELMAELGSMTQVVAKLLALDSSYYSNFMSSLKAEQITPSAESLSRQTSRTGFFGSTTPASARTFARFNKGQRFFAPSYGGQ